MLKASLITIVVGLLVLGGGYYLYTKVYQKASPVQKTIPNSASQQPGDTSKKAGDVDFSKLGKSITVDLAETKNSAVSGKATLTELDGKYVEVKIELDGKFASDSAMPAHIHQGACPEPGLVEYPLATVIGGKSDSVVAVPLSQLMSKLPLAINVHASVQKSNDYISCGNITSQ